MEKRFFHSVTVRSHGSGDIILEPLILSHKHASLQFPISICTYDRDKAPEAHVDITNDRDSKALVEASLPREPRMYDTIFKRSGVPVATHYHRNHGRPSIQAKAQSQQYLTISKEKALEKYLKVISDFGYPVQIKFLPSLAYSIACQRSTATNTSIKPLSKNWAQAFQKRHLGLKSRRVKALD